MRHAASGRAPAARLLGVCCLWSLMHVENVCRYHHGLEEKAAGAFGKASGS